MNYKIGNKNIQQRCNPTISPILKDFKYSLNFPTEKVSELKIPNTSTFSTNMEAFTMNTIITTMQMVNLKNPPVTKMMTLKESSWSMSLRKMMIMITTINNMVDMPMTMMITTMIITINIRKLSKLSHIIKPFFMSTQSKLL